MIKNINVNKIFKNKFFDFYYLFSPDIRNARVCCWPQTSTILKKSHSDVGQDNTKSVTVIFNITYHYNLMETISFVMCIPVIYCNSLLCGFNLHLCYKNNSSETI